MLVVLESTSIARTARAAMPRRPRPALSMARGESMSAWLDRPFRCLFGRHLPLALENMPGSAVICERCGKELTPEAYDDGPVFSARPLASASGKEPRVQAATADALNAAIYTGLHRRFARMAHVEVTISRDLKIAPGMAQMLWEGRAAGAAVVAISRMVASYPEVAAEIFRVLGLSSAPLMREKVAMELRRVLEMVEGA